MSDDFKAQMRVLTLIAVILAVVTLLVIMCGCAEPQCEYTRTADVKEKPDETFSRRLDPDGLLWLRSLERDEVVERQLR